MSNPLPNALALSTINDGDEAIASPLRNNYAAIQTAVNLLREALAGGTAGQILSAVDGTDVQWVNLIRYRKTTAKIVVNSAAETDLLNNEITVGAGVLGTNGVLRLTAWGDSVNNSGASQAVPRFKVKLGGSTLIDTGIAGASTWAATAGRFGWRITVEIVNLGVANSQWVTFLMNFGASTGTGDRAAFTTGEGIYGGWTAGGDGFQAVGSNSGGLDTTLAQALLLTVTNPVANAALDVTLKGALVEII